MEDDKPKSIEVRKDPTGSSRIIIDVKHESDADIEASKHHGPPATIIKRWEAWSSILLFSITSAVQYEIVPPGGVKYAMWIVSILAQLGLIFGKPLLIRGPRQEIQMEKSK